MVKVEVRMKFTGEPFKRVPVTLVYDDDPDSLVQAATDRDGVAEFAGARRASGKIEVDGVVRYQGVLEGDILVELWSLVEPCSVHDEGAPGSGGGSTAYASMQTRALQVDGREILTDSEGYLVDLGDWSEAFARALAQQEGLALGAEHWEVIRFLRDYYERKGLQAPVRDMIKHFRALWGRDRGSNRYLHELFPRGGPQKQGNRLAGLLRTKGEH